MSDTPDIKVLQINMNKNQYATVSVLQKAIELSISIIAVQEPWLIPPERVQPSFLNTRSITHPNFIQIFPNSPPNQRPRTMIYVACQLGSMVKLCC